MQLKTLWNLPYGDPVFAKGKRKQVILEIYEEPSASGMNEGPPPMYLRLFTILWIMLYLVEKPI